MPTYVFSVANSENQDNWDSIRGFIDCNSHITTDHYKPGPKVSTYISNTKKEKKNCV